MQNMPKYARIYIISLVLTYEVSETPNVVYCAYCSWFGLTLKASVIAAVCSKCCCQLVRHMRRLARPPKTKDNLLRCCHTNHFAHFAKKAPCVDKQ